MGGQGGMMEANLLVGDLFSGLFLSKEPSYLPRLLLLSSLCKVENLCWAPSPFTNKSLLLLSTPSASEIDMLQLATYPQIRHVRKTLQLEKW